MQNIVQFTNVQGIGGAVYQNGFTHFDEKKKVFVNAFGGINGTVFRSSIEFAFIDYDFQNILYSFEDTDLKLPNRKQLNFYDENETSIYAIVRIDKTLLTGNVPVDDDYCTAIVKYDVNLNNSTTNRTIISNLFDTIGNLSDSSGDIYQICGFSRDRERLLVLGGGMFFEVNISSGVVSNTINSNPGGQCIKIDYTNKLLYTTVIISSGMVNTNSVNTFSYVDGTLTPLGNFTAYSTPEGANGLRCYCFKYTNNNTILRFGSNDTGGSSYTVLDEYDLNMNLLSRKEINFGGGFNTGAGSLYSLLITDSLDIHCRTRSFGTPENLLTNYYRLRLLQTTSNKPLFSGDVVAGEQVTRDKPLGLPLPHIVEIDTTLSGVTSNNQFQTTGMVGNYNIYYDDKQGTNGWITNLKDEEILTFPQGGIYELSIHFVTKIQGFQFNDSGDKDKLLKIKQWGGADYSRNGSFRGCSNLTEVITNEYITISGVNTFNQCTSLTTFNVNIIVFTTYMTNTFYGCINLTSVNFRGFKTHLITRMENVFYDCPLTHIDASYWNVENLVLMINGGLAGNGNTNIETIDVTGWKPKNLQSMSVGFFNLTNIREIIGIDKWETPNLTQLRQAFFFCGFNNPNYIPLNLSNWNMSNVSNMFQTFRAVKLSGDISKWDVSKVTDMRWNESSLLNFKPISSEVYTKCLIAWSQLNLEPNVEFVLGATQYEASAASARQYIINTFGWTIIDGGQL